MLFHCRDGRVEEVLLPNCLDHHPPEGRGHGTGMEHLDFTHAALHYSGIHTPIYGVHPYHPLRDAKVTIAEEGATEPPECSLAKLAHLDNARWRLDASHPRSVVKLLGGTVSTKYGPDTVPATSATRGSRHFTFDGGIVHDHVEIRYEAPVTIDIAGQRPLRLTDGDVYVYDFDLPNPNERQLSEGRPHNNPREIVDHDFKWLYALVYPRTGGNRREATDGHLAAPVSDNAGDFEVLTIFVSTCFPAVIDE